MRGYVWSACVLALPLVISGCGGSETSPPSTTKPTQPTAATQPSATPPSTQAKAAEDEEYELDVIAEAEPDEGAPPLKVQFTGSVEEEEGGPWKFEWDFGDGEKSADQNPLHTYQKVGEYTATLTVTGKNGNKGTDEIDIFVETDDE